MSQIQSAALTLAGVTLAYLLIVFLVARWRRNAAAPQQPSHAAAPRLPRNISLPRRNRVMEAPVEIPPARLARISRKAPLADPIEATPDADLRVAEQPAPAGRVAPREVEQAEVPQMLESIVAQVKQEADRIEPGNTGAVVVRLVPQVPPRDNAHPTSWLGGRPRLDRGVTWPEIRETPATFVAQISFADLPRDLWDGLGPRSGAFAVFTHPRDGDTAIIPVADPGEPIDPSRSQDDAEHWFAPRDALHFGDLKPFSRSGTPTWPVDLVAVRPGDIDPLDAETAEGVSPGDSLYRAGYDIADPAFHPFNWDLMVALAEILAMRIERFWRDVDGPSPIAAQLSQVESRLDADGDAEELDNMRVSLGELVVATEAATARNRDARIRAEEIITIIRDSAHRSAFSQSDAAAVMEAIRAIRWTKIHRSPDPENRPGAERIETQTLPLTQHHPDAPLWVHDYHHVWFDHARRAYAADPDALSGAARAIVEPWCRELATRAMGSIGTPPDTHPETYATLLDLPSSALLGWDFGGADRLTLALRKADLAMGRFDRPVA